MLDIKIREYHLGLVKWFGGYNYHESRENDFGFIQPMNGNDLYVHRSKIKSGKELNENEIVVFEIGERNDKSYARNVHGALHEPEIIESVIQLYNKYKEIHAGFYNSRVFQRSLKDLLNNDFIENSEEEIFLEFLLTLYNEDYNFLFKKLDLFFSVKEKFSKKPLDLILENIDNIGVNVILKSNNLSKYLLNKKISNYIYLYEPSFMEKLSSNQIKSLLNDNVINIESVFNNPSYISYAFENLDDHKEFFKTLVQYSRNNIDIFDSIIEKKNWYGIFMKLVGRKSIQTLLKTGLNLNQMPRKYRIEHEDKLYDYIKNLKNKDDFFKTNIEKISKHLLLTCIIEGLLSDEDLISSRKSDITIIIENKFRDIDQDLPDFLNRQLEKLSKNITDYCLIPAIKSIMGPILFKKLLYDKVPQAKQVADESIYLSSSIEYFVLANLFPLIQAKNTTDIAFKVFLHHLWEALKNDRIDISDVDLLHLFPSCSTMGYDDLSCEAFYWEKRKEFLCRGRICDDPRILPDTNKNYFDYNIYDWFKHYGIDYINEGNPSKKDFPIKLAGYFNRLKEIFDIIKCRECYSLMLPDMRYAKVEYYDYDFDKKKYVKKNTAAAYRVTVFECGNAECSLFETKYYINHCLGFGCYSIIDSRDLKLKCGNGLYICRGCGSCCEQCAKEHPNGFCPDCGNNLILYEKNKSRFVYCSIRDCGFKISEFKLPKKFTLQSQPVIKINGNSNDRNDYSNYGSDDYDDLPF